MIELRYRIVDVFTDRPLAGNALCVVLDSAPRAVMQAIAREVNLSETTFPVVTGDGEYDVSIFTPSAELPFAGHPTLGTAWVLGPGRWRQTSPGGTVEVEVTAERAAMRQPSARFIEVYPGDACRALGIAESSAPRAWVADVAGTRHLVLPLEHDVAALRPDLGATTAMLRGVGAVGLAPFRCVDDATLHARVFLPGIGIPEDAGTGSAAGPIAVLARRLWGTSEEVTIRQGEEIGRPSRIEVSLAESEPWVGGPVAACAEGRFTLRG